MAWSKAIAKRLGLPCGATTSRQHLERFIADFAASVPAGAIVLDAGAGDSPYRVMFAHARYEATDVGVRASHRYAHVNYICDLASIPVTSARYDAVLCTQVLEHVTNPRAVLSEFARIMKPGGRLWLSTPLYFEEHEVPYDFFRYTQFGLNEIARAAGLEVEEIGWVSGYFGTLAHQVSMARRALPRHPRDYGGGLLGTAAAGLSLVLRPLFGLLALHYATLDLRHRYVTEAGHCMDYYLVAKRRGSRDTEAAAGRCQSQG